MTVRWLIPGESLLIDGQVFPLAGCHIVLQRKSKHSLSQEDQVPTVELWFNTPIDGSIEYEITVDSIGVVKMERVTQLQPFSDRSLRKWLVCVDGDDALMLRRLIRSHAKQTTRQCLELDPVPSTVNTSWRRQTQTGRSPNSWLEECPNYWDYIDVDHPSYQ
ncbi:MAG: hypothetical protein NW224_12955 [Leptolyngbyaceae cyanobacterium bins.302]|nr:hypothetical protein [Leptolyngbyaceae cyanobacterium bins.302]